MGSDPINGLIDCVARVRQQGYIFDSERVVFGLKQVEFGQPLAHTNRAHVEAFLRFLASQDGYFGESNCNNATALLNRLRAGHDEANRPLGQRTVDGLEKPGQRPPPLPNRPPPPVSVAIAIPPGAQPGVDVLIRIPHQSLLDLYTAAVSRGIGTPEQHRAVQKALWLRPLEPKDYRFIIAFLERTKSLGGVSDPLLSNRARFLVEMLAPGADPHELAQRLRTSGLAQQISRLPPPSTQEPAVLPGRSLRVAAATLDDLLLDLSGLIRQAAEEGDTHRLEKLAAAARSVVRAMDETQLPSMGLKVVDVTPAASKRLPFPKFFEPIKPFARRKYPWAAFDHVATSPYTNVALMPLGVVEHVLAGVAMGELTWEESWNEAVGAMGGSAAVGGTLIGTVGVWHLFGKMMGNEKLQALLKKINKVAPPRLRSYLVPLTVLSAFTFVGLRQTQTLPPDEEWEYRWNFLEEMLGGIGVNFVATSGAFFGINGLLARSGRAAAGMWGAAAVLAAAGGMGMVAQEIVTTLLRRHFRQTLKEKTYAETVEMIETLPTFPHALRPKLLNRIDRKFAVLIALNLLELKSVREAMALSERRQARFAQLRQLGLSEADILRILGQPTGSMEALAPKEREMAGHWQFWQKERGGKEYTEVLPVAVLPAQQHRIVTLWQEDLSDIYEFFAQPVSLVIGRDEGGNIPSHQFSQWSMAHTMALLRRYLETRAAIGEK